MNIKGKKILARVGLVLLALIVLGLAVRAALNVITENRLQSAIKAMKAEGRRLSVRDFEPRCRDLDNAALIWQGIEAMFVKDFDSPAIIGAPGESLREGKSLDPSTRDRIEETAGKYSFIFYLLREAANKPCFKYARRWGNVAFGLKYMNLHKLSPLFRLFMLNAYVQAEKGDQNRAVGDCLIALRHLSFFACEPHPFNRFFGTVLMMESLEDLRSVLKKGTTEERICQSVLQELDKQEPQQILRLSLQLEQAMILEEYMHYFRGDARESLMNKFLIWLFKPMLKSEALFVLNLGNDLEKAVSRPFYAQRGLLSAYMQKANNIPGTYRLARIFHPSVGPWLWGKYVRIEAALDVIRTALACRIHRLRHGRLPESLDSLAPEILAKVPADPFTGRPLVYRPRPKGFILYSLGPNLKDDKGQGMWGWATKAGDDIAWEE